MPTYDFKCEDCNRDFSVVQSMSEFKKGGIVCPKCGSKRVLRVMHEFYAKTVRKS